MPTRNNFPKFRYRVTALLSCGDLVERVVISLAPWTTGKQVSCPSCGESADVVDSEYDTEHYAGF